MIVNFISSAISIIIITVIIFIPMITIVGYVKDPKLSHYDKLLLFAILPLLIIVALAYTKFTPNNSILPVDFTNTTYIYISIILALVITTAFVIRFKNL